MRKIVMATILMMALILMWLSIFNSPLLQSKQSSISSRLDWHNMVSYSTHDLRFPSTCFWAVDQLYSMQRTDVNVRNPTDVSRSAERVFKLWIQPFLPPLEVMPAPRIMDIGGGLGMYHIFAYRHYQNRSVHVVVDKEANDISAKKMPYSEHGGWHSDRLPFYSSLSCSKEIAVFNGVASSSWQTVDASFDNIMARGRGSMDIVMSMLSWGWHYPLETDRYLKAVLHVLKPEGLLILTARRSHGVLEQLAQVGFECAVTDWEQHGQGDLAACRLHPSEA